MNTRPMTFELIDSTTQIATEEKRMTVFEANNKNYTLRSRSVNSQWVAK